MSLRPVTPRERREAVEADRQARLEAFRVQMTQSLRMVPQGPGWIDLAEVSE